MTSNLSSFFYCGVIGEQILTYWVFHPVDGLFIIIKVNIIAIVKTSHRNHSIIALIFWV